MPTCVSHAMFASVLAGFASWCLLPASASAAIISGTAIGSPTAPANLTQSGALDWAYWDARSNTALAAMAATNFMSGGADIIGDAIPISGTAVRGSTTPSNITFSFDNGTSPASLTGRAVAGVFNSQIGTTTGRGVRVSLTLPDTQLYKVSLWVSGYFATGTLTAALDGATSYSDSSFAYTGGTKPAKLYELEVMPNQPGDAMTLSYVTSAATDGSSHLLIAGLAVSVVPEPTALALLAPLAILPLRRRRY